MLVTYLELADSTYLAGDRDTSLEMYLNAVKIDEWILKEHPPIFLSSNSPKPDIFFMFSIADQAKGKIGKSDDAFSTMYRELLAEKIATDGYPLQTDMSTMQVQHDFILQSYTHILEITPWVNNELWKEISQVFLLAKNGNDQLSSTILEQWYSFWERSQHYLDSDEQYGLDYVMEDKLAQELQRTATQALKNRDIQTAVQLTQKLQLVHADEYAGMAQLGHLYSYLGEIDKAKQAYAVCAERFMQMSQNEKHFDCEVGLYLLDTAEPWKERYFQVSSTILEEADWSDF